jgi:hypothetical protein
MIYLLEFLWFLAVAVILAASPLLVRIFEYIFPRRANGSPPAAGGESVAARTDERSELRDEIHRMITLLEVGGSDISRNPDLPVEKYSRISAAAQAQQDYRPR